MALRELIYMEGYGDYVWGACLLIAIALLVEQVLLVWRKRSVLGHLGRASANQGKDETAA